MLSKNAKHSKAETKEPTKPLEDAVTPDAETVEPTETVETTEAASAESKAGDGATETAYNELLDRYQRLFAEFDNFRKRTIKEKASIYEDGVRDTIEKILPVVDNFERALEANEDKTDKFYQGVVLIARQLNAAMTNIGVEMIPGPGEAFDPNFHYAVAHVEDDQYGVNTIVEEMQKGYKYKDKVIRPSMVKVAN